eukprot:350678_1
MGNKPATLDWIFQKVNLYCTDDIFTCAKQTCLKMDIPSDKIIANCLCLKRISVGLEYYKILCNQQTTNIVSSQYHQRSGKQKFAEFCIETYRCFLDDFIHILKHHNNHLKQIATELIDEYGFESCDIIKCNQMKRHYRINSNDNHLVEDPYYAFYEQCYDRLHHFIFHLYDIGARVDKQFATRTNSLCINDEFAKIRNIITTKRKFDIDRYNCKNNKYNLYINDKHFDVNITFLEGMYQHCLHSHDAVTDDEIIALDKYFQDNEYDTDAVQADLIDCCSNIATFVMKR